MAKTVVVNFGRMNPPTIGHEKLANVVKDTAKKFNGEPRLYLSHSQDNKKNPLDYNTKMSLVQKAFGIAKKSPAKNIIGVAQETEKEGFDTFVVVVGSDRYTEFKTLLNKYNGRDYNFDKIVVVSAGERDPDAEGAAGMSGTKLRELIKNNMMKSAFEGLPSKLSNADKKKIFDIVKKNIKEEEESIMSESRNKKVADFLKESFKPVEKKDPLYSFKVHEAKDDFVVIDPKSGKVLARFDNQGKAERYAKVKRADVLTGKEYAMMSEADVSKFYSGPSSDMLRKRSEPWEKQAAADMKAGKSVAWFLDRKQGAGQKWSIGTQFWFDAEKYQKQYDKVGSKVKRLFKMGEELDEGKMKELHMYMQQGKSPEWIAKKMGLDAKTIKSLIGETIEEFYVAVKYDAKGKKTGERKVFKDLKSATAYASKMGKEYRVHSEASARADALKAMGSRRGIDPADIDTNSDAADDEKDVNIIMQLRKVISLRGLKPVKFANGKTVKLTVPQAQVALDKFNKMRTSIQKGDYMKKLQKSPEDFKKALAEDVDIDTITSKFIAQQLEEKLKASDGLGAWISDFHKSDAPQFDGKSKEERTKMAIAAFVGAGGKLDEEVEIAEEMSKDMAKGILSMVKNRDFKITPGDRVPMVYLNNADREALAKKYGKLSKDVPGPSKGIPVTALVNLAMQGKSRGDLDTEGGKHIISWNKGGKKIGTPKKIADVAKLANLRLESEDIKKN